MYQKLLLFHACAYDVLKRSGVKLLVKKALEQESLPKLVKEFLEQAENLNMAISNATLGMANELHDVSIRDQIKLQHQALIVTLC